MKSFLTTAILSIGLANVVFIGPANSLVPPPTLDWDAGQDRDGDRFWESTVNGTDRRRWNFGSGNNPTAIAVFEPRFNVTEAYCFSTACPEGIDGAAATMASFQNLGFETPNPTNQEATFELLLRTADRTGRHVLFETGGSGDGTVFYLDGTDLTFLVKDGSVRSSIPVPIVEGEFVHLIGTIDLDGGAIALYQNGALVNSVSFTGSDWAGGNGSGLARANGSTPAGGSFTDFNGDIALLRFYRDITFNQAQVRERFQTLTTRSEIPEPSSILGLGLVLGLAGLSAARK